MRRACVSVVSRTLSSTSVARVSAISTLPRRSLSVRNWFGGASENENREHQLLADALPHDAGAQAQYMRLLNKAPTTANCAAIQRRFESGAVAINDEAKREYLRAMSFLGRLDSVRLDLLGGHLTTQAAQATPGALTTAHTSGGDAATVPSASDAFQLGRATAPVDTAAAASAVSRFYERVYGGSRGQAQADADGSVPIRIIVPHRDRWQAFLAKLLEIGLVVGIIYYFLSSRNEGSTTMFPIADAHQLSLGTDQRFSDVIGIDEAKAELEEVVEYLRDPAKFAAMGARLPKGVLLVGEPGTGKTLLARAIAGEAGVPFIHCSGSAFDEMFVGVGPKRVRSLFEEARKVAPCIVFIDEIDAMGMSRTGGTQQSASGKDSTLNQILTEMDGFDQTHGIICIAATNIPDTLDPALVRPGRFDKQIVVPLPDVKGRSQILDLYLSKVKAAPSVDSRVLARGTPGFTGADLSNLVNLAAVKAVMQGRPQVDMSLLEEAKDDVIMGLRRTTAEPDANERRNTAYHEAGHALVGLNMKGAHPLHKVTIIQRGQALGVTVNVPEKDEYQMTKQQMLAQLAMLMGGRAAERLVLGDEHVTSGATSDLMKATSLARNMVEKFGFSQLVGPVYHDNKNHRFAPSDEQRRLIDSEVKKLVDQAYETAAACLSAHEQQLHTLAHGLLEHETLTGDQVRAMLQTAPQTAPHAAPHGAVHGTQAAPQPAPSVLPGVPAFDKLHDAIVLTPVGLGLSTS